MKKMKTERDPAGVFFFNSVFILSLFFIFPKMKKMKTERESAGGFFNSVFILSLKYLMA